MKLVPVPGVEGYAVTFSGEVWSLMPGRWNRFKEPHRLATHRDRRGYLQVCLRANGSKKRYAVHELVAKAFLGPRPAGMVTRHLDGDSTNNTASNLAYGTQQQNIDDRERLGRTVRGDKSHLAKVTDDQCREIVRQFEAGVPRAKIAACFGVSESHVYSLSAGKFRKHLFKGAAICKTLSNSATSSR